MRIFIIGFMGCGKSTLGQKLASTLNMKFIDTDKEIENYSKLKIAEIFNRLGEDKFRTIENQVFKNIVKKDNVVISTGGGTPCFYNNMELITKNGISIYLKMSINQIITRFKNHKIKRPLLGELKELPLKNRVGNLLKQREKSYNKATYIIDGENYDIKELVSLLTIVCQESITAIK